MATNSSQNIHQFFGKFIKMIDVNFLRDILSRIIFTFWMDVLLRSEHSENSSKIDDGASETLVE